MKRINPTEDCPLYDAKKERCGQTGFADPCPLRKRYRCPKPETTEFEEHAGDEIWIGEDRDSISRERP